MHPTATPAGQARYAELNRKPKGYLVSVARNPVPGRHSLTPPSEMSRWSKHELIMQIMHAEDDQAAEQAGYTRVLGEMIGRGNGIWGNDIWGFGVVTKAAINPEQPGAMTVTNETGKQCDVYADQKYWVRKN